MIRKRSSGDWEVEASFIDGYYIDTFMKDSIC